MTAKKKYEEAKSKLAQLMKERPLETVAAMSAAVLATAKLISSITEARNSATWKREVKRREQNQQMKRYR